MKEKVMRKLTQEKIMTTNRKEKEKETERSYREIEPQLPIFLLVHFNSISIKCFIWIAFHFLSFFFLGINVNERKGNER